MSPPPRWFTEAAIERIVGCVSNFTGSHVTAAMLINEYLESKPEQNEVGLEHDDLYFTKFRRKGERRRFYDFAGLLEIGASIGYLELRDWSELKMFSTALQKFERQESAYEAYPSDLLLIRELLSRLRQKSSPKTPIDTSLFYAFASYLQLHAAIRGDTRLSQFLWDTKRWDPDLLNSDLSFLLSPRFFSEALSTGAIAGIYIPDVINGLATLNYFQWFTDILERVYHNQQTVDKLIRHARWSHHIGRVQARIEVLGHKDE